MAEIRACSVSGRAAGAKARTVVELATQRDQTIPRRAERRRRWRREVLLQPSANAQAQLRVDAQRPTMFTCRGFDKAQRGVGGPAPEPVDGVDAGRSAAATAGASPAAAIALVMSPERAREERGGECGSG